MAYLRTNFLFRALPTPTPMLKPFINAHRQEQLELLREKKVLLRGCRPHLGIDPIMYVPATRSERSRLLRWRMGWLPGKPRPCQCGTNHTSRRHLVQCPEIPHALWQALPSSPPNQHPLDFAITSLPFSTTVPPPYWQPLLKLLRQIDQICLPNTSFPEEPQPGALWLCPPSHSERSPSPLP